MVFSKWGLFRRWALYSDAVPVFVGSWRGESVRVWVRRLSRPTYYVHVGDLVIGDKLILYEGLKCASEYFLQVTGKSLELSFLFQNPHFRQLQVGSALVLFRSTLKAVWEHILTEGRGAKNGF